MKRMKGSKQGGFLSIEAFVVLVVAVAGMSLGFQWLKADSQRKINHAAAEHASTFADATTRWMKDNFSAIEAAATPSVQYTAAAVTGYLPSWFNTTNPYGQAYSIRVYKPAANQLQTMVVTTAGETIGEQDVRKVAQLIGAKGGYVSSSDTTRAQGSYGGWNMPFTNFGTSPGAGKIATALFFQDGALVSDYLYRNNVPGHPELNRMNTAIDMAGNNINAAGTVNSTTVAATENVTAGGTVTATTADIAGETYTEGWFRTRGDGGWYSQKWKGGWHMRDSTWIRAYADKSVYTGGQVQAGSVRANGRLSTGEYVHIEGVAVEGTSCAQNGLVGRDAAGLLLSCQSGFWKNTGAAKVNTGACIARNWGANFMCPANHVVAGADFRSSDSGEWNRFYCCPLQ